MKKHDFVTTGIPSIFMIFTVLVLVILSLMSLGTSRSDREESLLSYDTTRSYYEAGETATQIFSEAVQVYANEGAEAMKDYLLHPAEPLTCLYEEESQAYRLTIPYTGRQALLVELAEGSGSCPLIVKTWMSIQTGSWKDESTMNLFIPGQPF